MSRKGSKSNIGGLNGTFISVGRERSSLTEMDLAAAEGDVSALTRLLKTNNVNERDTEGFTPLHAAAYQGHADCVQVLLAAEGIEIETRHPDGSTPLHATAAM